MQKVIWHKRMTPNSKPGENDWIIILYSTDKRVGDLLRQDSICLLYSLAWGYLRLQSQMQVRRWRIKPGTMLGCRRGKHANKDYSRKSAQWVRYPDRLLNSSKTSSREAASHSTVLSSVQVGNNIIIGSISCFPFSVHTDSVPVWMFNWWADQMVTLPDVSTGCEAISSSWWAVSYLSISHHQKGNTGLLVLDSTLSSLIWMMLARC